MVGGRRRTLVLLKALVETEGGMSSVFLSLGDVFSCLLATPSLLSV